MKPILVLLTPLLMLSLGCERPAPKPVADESPYQKPTATEVFNLRSRCAELGDQIWKDHMMKSSLDQTHLVHYEPKTNRCYVELRIYLAHDGLGSADLKGRTLYDGQTREVLAFVHSRMDKQEAWSWDGIDVFDTINRRIDSLMGEDKRPWDSNLAFESQ